MGYSQEVYERVEKKLYQMRIKSQEELNNRKKNFYKISQLNIQQSAYLYNIFTDIMHNIYRKSLLSSFYVARALKVT